MLNFFKRLFGQDKNEIDIPDPAGTLPLKDPPRGFTESDPNATAPLDDEDNNAVGQSVKIIQRPFGEGPGAPQMLISHAQSVGVVRDHNEDVLLSMTNNFCGHDDMPAFGLFVVADGMGGHSLGERAAAVATRAVTDHIMREVYLPLLNEPSSMSKLPPLQEVVEAALENANRRVAREVPNGGTTTTMALVLHNRLIVGHVGDSRAYLITHGNNGDGPVLRQITRDHSLVQRLQELGQLTAEEAAEHPQRNVLYRAIGQGEGLEIDVENFGLPPQSRLLICSDGLWGLVEDEDLTAIVRTSASSQIACERMIAAANAAGGPDNITVIMVDFP